jgi:cytochrome c
MSATFARVAVLFLGIPLTAAMSAAVLAAPSKPDGGQVFKQRCQACHSATAAKTTPLAPNLAGVVGRKAAATSFAYSPALKASKLTWTRASLDKYLAAPMKTVPGTRMVVSIPDPAARAAVIDFLAKAK